MRLLVSYDGSESDPDALGPARVPCAASGHRLRHPSCPALVTRRP